MSDRILDYQAGIEHLIAQLQSLSYYGKYVPGSIVPSFTSIAWGDIKGNIENQKDLMAQFEKLHKEIEDAIIGTLSSVFIYKGSVATKEDLPKTDLESGYCYNVEEDGANYVWNGTEWDKLSETIDLSNYVEKEELEQSLELYYLKTELDDIINAMAVDLGTQINLKASKTELQDLNDLVISLNNDVVDGVNAEINARKAADNVINDRIDQVITDTNTALDNLETKVDNHIADAEAHSATKEDLKNYYTKAESNNLLNDKVDKKIESSTGKALIFNEVDGGGAKFEKADGQYSFAGVNDMTDPNGVGVQLYNINTKDGNKGPRIQLTKDRATYSKDVTLVTEEYEIATKGDINSLLAEEVSARQDADADLQTAIEKVASDLADHIAEAETGYVTNTQLSEAVTNLENADSVLDARLDTLEGKDFVEYTDISNQENPNRKAIVFKNHDGIFGKDTEGNTRNLAMISKYNVADFGTTHLHTNLNTQQIVTVNDNQAVLTDKNLNNVVLPGDKITIDTALVTEPDTGFVFQTLTVNADLSEYYNKSEVDDLLQDMEVGQLRNDLNQEIQDRQDADDALEDRIEALETKTEAIFHYRGAVAKVANLPQVDNEVGDTYNVEETGANYCWNGTTWDKLSETIDLSAYDLTANRQAADTAIISKIWSNPTMTGGYFTTKYNYDNGSFALLFNETDGGGSQVFDKTDNVKSYVGTNLEEGKGADTDAVNVQIYSLDDTTKSGTRLNVNTSGIYYVKGERGQGNPEAREIAVKSDVTQVQNSLNTLQDTVDNTLATQDGNIQALLLKMDELQSKIEDLKSLDYEVITLYDGADTDYDNEEKSFQLSGVINTRLVVAGENVTLDEATIESAFVELDTIEDITIKDSTYSGNTPKAMSNAILKLHADGYVSIRDCTITPEKAYNGIEVGLSQGLSKSVIIDNVTFDGPLTNNAINIFGMDEGGVVTISNCYFKKVSNLLRISNRTNTHWTINIINCVCDQWEAGEYAGMILLQDYTSGSAAAANENDIFSKLTINIQNCTKPDGTKIVPVEDLSTICGTKDNNQIIYMWDSWRNHTAYGDKYPTINII